MFFYLLAALAPTASPVAPALRLNRGPWRVLVWKHADHHFRQFGV